MSPRTPDNDKEIESAFREAIECFPPPDGLQEAIAAELSRIGAPQAYSKSMEAAATSARPKRSAVRILKWVLPLATACAAGAIVIVSLLPGPAIVQSAYAEIATAVGNSKAAEWVHFVSHNGQLETWASLHPYRMFEKSVKGDVAFDDGDSYELLRYDPAQKTIRMLDSDMAGSDVAASPTFLDVIMSSINEGKDRGLTFEKSQSTVNGKKCTVYYVKDPGGTSWTKLAVDDKAKQIVRWENLVYGQQIAMDFDYPESGPKDIYALGVPRDAKIVDKRTRDHQSTIMMANAAKAEREFDADFRAVVVLGPFDPKTKTLVVDNIDVYYQKHHQRRNDTWTRVSSSSTSLAAEKVEDVEKYMTTRSPSNVDMTAPGGSVLYNLTCAKEVRKSVSQGGPARLQNLFWQTFADRFGHAVPDVTAPDGRLLGTQRVSPTVIWQNEVTRLPVRWTIYFNPERDYITERSEEWIGGLKESWLPESEKSKTFPAVSENANDPGKTITTVLEYAKTPSGHWYPKKQLIDGEYQGKRGIFMRIIYLDTKYQFPDGLFSADKFESKLDRPVKAR